MSERDEVWITADGKEIPIGDLTEPHAKNILRMLLREHRENEITRKFEATKTKHINNLKRV